jgi:predicted dehydrogenase
VFCEDAVLWADDDHVGPLHVVTSEGETTVDGGMPAWIPGLALPDEVAALIAPYAAAAKAFLDAVGAGGTGSPDAETALAAHRLVDLAYRSSAAGGVPLPT